MSEAAVLTELADKFRSVDPLGLPLSAELERLCNILPYDMEMAVVRSRRIVDLVMRTLLTKQAGPAGTRPLDQVLSELEKHQVLPREIVAHARSLKEVANLCAHEGVSNTEGLQVCIIDLVVIMRWFSRYVEQLATSAPGFRTIDGFDVADEFDRVIEDVFRLDFTVFGSSDETSFGCYDRSRAWYSQNPQIYTFLYSGSQLVGYSNVMPLEEDAWECLLRGQLHDGLIDADMIRRYEAPDFYRLYVCCIAILPEFRRYPAAFGLLYDALFQKLFRLAEHEIYVSEVACNAWSREGRSLATSFRMAPVVPHDYHGHIYRCSIIPPSVESPSRRLRHLLGRYRDLGLIEGSG